MKKKAAIKVLESLKDYPDFPEDIQACVNEAIDVAVKCIKKCRKKEKNNDELGDLLSGSGFAQSDPYILNYCENCPSHPSNGGSGICHCILGSPQITC